MIQFIKSELKFLLHLYDIAKENKCSIDEIKLIENPALTYQVNFCYADVNSFAETKIIMISILITKEHIYKEDISELCEKIKKIINDNIPETNEVNKYEQT